MATSERRKCNELSYDYDDFLMNTPFLNTLFLSIHHPKALGRLLFKKKVSKDCGWRAFNHLINRYQYMVDVKLN